MKTYVKIIILIATLGVGFGIGWFCREMVFKDNLTMAVGHEYRVERFGGDSLVKPGMSPRDLVNKIGSKLLDL